MRKGTFLLAGFLVFLGVFSPLVFAQTTNPHLSFSPSTTTVTVGETFDVDVLVDTGGQAVDGVDAIISYDQDLLEAVSVTAGSFLSTTTNSLATAGKIKIYGVAESGSPKTGTGTLATITLRAKSAGEATLTFDCQSGVTTDSNINKGSEDIIVCTSNGTGVYTLGSSTSSASLSATPSPTVVASSSVSTTSADLPATGAFSNTLILLGIGVALSFLGFAFLF